MEGSEAVASLCGLVLRRLQENVGVPGVTEKDHTLVSVHDLSQIFGEALEQFSRLPVERINEEDGA